MMSRSASQHSTRARAAAKAPSTFGIGMIKSSSPTLMEPSPSMYLILFDLFKTIALVVYV